VRKQSVIVFALIASAAVFVGCGGGSSRTNPPAAGATAAPVAAGGMSTATFTLTIANTTDANGTNRKPAFISSNTQSMSIVVQSGSASPSAPIVANLTPGSPGCTSGSSGTTCAVTVPAPIGTNTFTIAMFSGTNGSGSLLSSASVSGTVVAAAANSFPVTLNGTVASVAVSITSGNNVIPGGYPTTLPVVVTAKDASGAIIIGPGNYTNPIALSNGDTTGATMLSTTAVTSPATAVTLTYCPSPAPPGGGGQSCVLPSGQTTIGASASGVPAALISAGTFQYITDRFFGYGHPRTLSGTGTVIVTTYASPTPLPTATTSIVAYSITDVVSAGYGASFNGQSPLVDNTHLYTYTQTVPSPIVSPEIATYDRFRRSTLTPTGALVYELGFALVDQNFATGNSPITGNAAGANTYTSTFLAPGNQVDLLPRVGGTTWPNSGAQTQVVTGPGQTSTFTLNSDGSQTFTQSAPSTIALTVTAGGSSTSTTGGITTTVGLPSPAPSAPAGFVIPVTISTPSPAPTSTTFLADDWYFSATGSAQPQSPLRLYGVAQAGPTALPADCNVPPGMIGSASIYAVTYNTKELRPNSGQYRVRIETDYFVHGGLGYICQTFRETISNYRLTTGVLLNTVQISWNLGVQNSAALGRSRRN
jgi:hypothetical protein